jgi:hypothetical protein
MGFQEKSAWACLVSIVVVFVPYFGYVLRSPMSYVAYVGLFVLAVVVQIVLLVGFHTVNAIFSPDMRRTGTPPPADELDRMIELRAAKISGAILGVVVICWCLGAMVYFPAQGVLAVAEADRSAAVIDARDFAVPVSSAVLAVHWLFGGFVIANVVYYGLIAWGYRRICHG